MFGGFFAALRAAGVPVSLREYLAFLEGLAAGLVTYDVDGFYHLARLTLVKSETRIDRFDRAFAASFAGLDQITPDALLQALDLPPAWLEKLAEKHLTPAEMAQIQAQGGFDALMAALKERLATQKERHQGGSKWIGTAGTSPFGAYGYNPEGVRIGQDTSRHQRAVKVWDKRSFRNLDDHAVLSSRTMALALKGLRRFARSGAADELDLDATIRATADHGYLDVQTRPQRRNAVKLLLFLDVGGSMEAHVTEVAALFQAARHEFRHLHAFYFHNCLYEGVWQDNRRRWSEQIPTWDVLHRYGPDYRCIFVGDAAMSPYEIAAPGGASEHMNAEAGQVWLARARDQWRANLWINPLPQAEWRYTQSIGMISAIFGPDRMVPMTLDGLARGMQLLSR